MTVRIRLVLGSALSLLLTTVQSASAQGPVYRERWGYLHLENRRAELGQALRRLDDSDQVLIARLLARPDDGVPFRPVAEALAHLRGVDCDAAFLLRATVGLYVLPEVVDPLSTVADCRSANFSVFLPFPVPSPGAISFELVVRDDQGTVVWRRALTRDTGIPDLRMARPQASMPIAALDGQAVPDGAYEVELRTLVAGEGPRDRDPELRWTFHVLRGYQQRSEAAIAGARQVREQLAPMPRALLDGLALQVSRAYVGEAFVVRSDAVAELQRLEQALANLRERRPVLAGIDGVVATALPGGGVVQPAVLRLPAAATGPKPLVVFVSGAPAYDVGARRPTAPVTREASWLMTALGDFGAAQGWNVVCIDSPGGGHAFGPALLVALRSLADVLPFGGHGPVLVCDREAAGVVGLKLAEFAPLLGGVAMIGAGAMPNTVVDRLGALPVRMVALNDYPGSQAVERMLAYVEVLREQGKPVPDLKRLHDRALAWPFGVEGSLPELERFCAEVFRER